MGMCQMRHIPIFYSLIIDRRKSVHLPHYCFFFSPIRLVPAIINTSAMAGGMLFSEEDYSCRSESRLMYVSSAFCISEIRMNSSAE